MISISKDELLALAAKHGGSMVGGNICARVNKETIWLAKQTDGIFALTDEGKAFVEAATKKPTKAPAKKPTKSPAKAAGTVDELKEVVDPAIEDDDLLEGL